MNVWRVEHTLNCFESFNIKENLLYHKQCASENVSSNLMMIYARNWRFRFNSEQTAFILSSVLHIMVSNSTVVCAFLVMRFTVLFLYPPELQLNKGNISDTEAPFLDLHLSISNGFVSSTIYNKHDDFDFHIVNFPFLVGDVPSRPSYGVYIYQLIRFARVCSHVDDFITRHKCLTAKLLKQGYRYHKLDQFRKIIMRYKRIGYNLNVM